MSAMCVPWEDRKPCACPFGDDGSPIHQMPVCRCGFHTYGAPDHGDWCGA